MYHFYMIETKALAFCIQWIYDTYSSETNEETLYCYGGQIMNVKVCWNSLSLTHKTQ